MRPVGVVVVDVVGDDPFELSLVPDDGAIEQLASQGPDPAFGERVGDRRPDRGREDLEAFGSEDLVEGVDELAASVTHERSSICEPVGMTEEQVPGRLGGPRAGRVGGYAGEEDFAGGDVDEEQQVVAAQQSGVDGGEVAGACAKMQTRPTGGTRQWTALVTSGLLPQTSGTK